MFTLDGEGGFVIDASDWEMAGCPDPMTDERVNVDHVLWHPIWNYDGEIVARKGRFPSGVKVTVYND